MAKPEAMRGTAPASNRQATDTHAPAAKATVNLFNGADPMVQLDSLTRSRGVGGLQNATLSRPA